MNPETDPLDGSPGDVLVVDNHPENLRTIEALLTEQGHKVRCISDAKTALDVAAHRPPEIMLLDVLMPDMDGYTVCRALKAQPETEAFPIIFLASLPEMENLAEGFEAGGAAFLSKPLRPEELMACVKTHVELYRARNAILDHKELLKHCANEQAVKLKEADRKLRESQAFNKTLLNSSPDIIYIYDITEKKNVYSNEGIMKVLGYSIEEIQVMGENLIPTLMHPEDMDIYLEETLPRYQKAGDGELIEHEYRMKHKDGGWRWLHSSESIFQRHSNGKAKQIFGVVRDITDRKLAYNALQESEEKLSKVFHSSPDSITLTSLENGQIIEANKSFERIFGHTREEAIGKTTLDLGIWYWSAADRDQMLATLRKNGIIRNMELALCTKSGEVITCLLSGDLIEVQGQGYLVAVTKDITELKRAENDLKEKEQTLRDFVETSRDWIWAINLRGIHTYSNQAIEKILGYAPDELVGKISLDYLHEQDRQTIESNLPIWIDEKSGWRNLVLRWKHKNGGWRWLESNAVPIFDIKGKLIGFRGVDRDITERKQTEETLRQKDYIIESASSAIANSDLNGKLTYANPVFLEKWGFDNPEEFLGEPFTKYWLVEGKLDEIMNRMFNEGKWNDEIQARRKDGSIFDVQVSAALVRDKEGNPVSLMSSSVDITERKLTENALLETTQLLETIFDSTHMHFAYLDAGFNFIRVNRAYAEADTKEPSFFIGKNHFDLYPSTENRKIFQQVVDSGDPHFEYAKAFEYGDHPERGTSYWDWSVIPIKAPDGTVKELLLTLMNVTEHVRTEQLLKEEKEFTETAINALNDTFFVFDPTNGKAIRWNKTFNKASGFTDDEIAQKKGPDDWYSPADLEKADAATQNVLKKGAATFEMSLITKSEKRIPTEYSASMIRDKEGNPKYIIAVGRDITERKQAEEKLRESEERFRSMMEQSPVGIEILNPDGHISQVNPAWQRLFCVSHETLSQVLEKYNILEDEQCRKLGVMPLIEKAFAGEPVVLPPIEYDIGSAFLDLGITNAEEKKMWFRSNLYPLKSVNGEIISVVNIYEDITERLLAEEKLLESETRYRTLFNAAGDGISIMKNGIFIECNQKYADLFGCPLDQVIGQSPGKFSPPTQPDGRDSNEKASEKINGALEGEPQFFEWQHRRSDGTLYDAEVTLNLLEIDSEKYLLAINRDVTERKKAEEEKKKLENRLVQSQKMEAIGTLAGGIAHDFNNILSSIFGFTELGRMKVEDGENIEDELEQVMQAGRRAKDLVQQILTFSRKSDVEKMPIRIEPLIKEVLKFIRASLPSTIKVQRKLNVSSCKVMADPTQIHQVLMNLCTNAAHAMKDTGGILDVRLDEVVLKGEASYNYKELKDGAYLRLTVADTGAGISKEVIDRIFEPFYTTKKREEGTGLGLSVVHGIIKDMLGSISVYSEPGKGTTFHILLPKYVGKVLEDKTAQPAIGKYEGLILFVDDEENIIGSVRGILERVGFEVVASTMPLEALDFFSERPNEFDVVLTDLTMPDITGLELARKLLEIRSDIPIVLTTGFSAGITPDIIKKAGIREMVMKPLIAGELLETIRRVMGFEKE